MEEMEVYQVLESCYIFSFEFTYISKIKKKVKDLYEYDLKAWNNFEGKLRDKFYNKDFSRISKRLFLE